MVLDGRVFDTCGIDVIHVHYGRVDLVSKPKTGFSRCIRTRVSKTSPPLFVVCVWYRRVLSRLSRHHLGGFIMDIFRAAREGNEQEMICWLEDPTWLEEADADGMRPLSLAARHGRPGMVEFLVRRRAKINARGEWGMTALHFAARGGHEKCSSLFEKMVEFLLSNGANANSKDDEGRTPLMFACMAGHMGVVRLLVQHSGAQGLDEGGDKGCTALHWASTRGHCEVVPFLLSKGAQASTRDIDGETPLISASSCGHVGLVHMLLQCMGPHALTDTDTEGWTALHNAAYWGHEETVAFLLKKGAPVNSRTLGGATPHMLACMGGHLGVVRVLLHHMGAQALHQTDDKGRTALHWACLGGQAEILRFLLLAGADHTITDKEGKTPRAIAEEEDEEEDNDMLKEAKVRCVAVLEWWDGELERRAVLHRAMCLHKAYTMRRDMPTSQVPTYLEARVAAGHAVPSVEVVSQQPEEQQQEGEEGLIASGMRKAAGEGDGAQGGQAGEEEERYAMLEHVVKTLNEALVTELLEGFH